MSDELKPCPHLQTSEYKTHRCLDCGNHMPIRYGTVEDELRAEIETLGIEIKAFHLQRDMDMWQFGLAKSILRFYAEKRNYHDDNAHALSGMHENTCSILMDEGDVARAFFKVVK